MPHPTDAKFDKLTPEAADVLCRAGGTFKISNGPNTLELCAIQSTITFVGSAIAYEIAALRDVCDKIEQSIRSGNGHSPLGTR